MGALRAQLTAMLVFMAECALLAQSQEGRVEVSYFDFGPSRRRNSFLRVATLARLLAMLALQKKARLGKVVEPLALQAD